MSRNAHPTKSGPGRHHKDGEKHGAAPPPFKGGDWIGQRTNPARNQKRRMMRGVGGRRQFIRQAKALRACMSVPQQVVA